MWCQMIPLWKQAGFFTWQSFQCWSNLNIKNNSYFKNNSLIQAMTSKQLFGTLKASPTQILNTDILNHNLTKLFKRQNNYRCPQAKRHQRTVFRGQNWNDACPFPFCLSRSWICSLVVCPSQSCSSLPVCPVQSCTSVVVCPGQNHKP